MWASVFTAFHGFSEPLEGRVPFWYLDNAEPEGLVTIGVGHLYDRRGATAPPPAALDLPLRRPDGSRASRAEIAAAWLAVKARQDLKAHGGGAFRNITTLRLLNEDIDRLVEQKLASNETFLSKRFPDWPTWPADAQLALHSWAWGVGAAAPYPKMTALLLAERFALAAAEVEMNPKKGTILKRNAANRLLLANAQHVLDCGLDPAELYWPRALATPPPASPDVPSHGAAATVIDFPVVHAWPEHVPAPIPSFDDDE